jgi:lysophospholipase L1-like esterase
LERFTSVERLVLLSLFVLILLGSVVSSSNSLNLAFAQPQPRPFNILAIGDSVMWGQGLLEQSKFYDLVANHIKSKYPNLIVNNRGLAHSGAIIGKDFSAPLFRWDKVPGEDEVKFRKLLTTNRPFIWASNPQFTPSVSKGIVDLFNKATIVKTNESTIQVNRNCGMLEFGSRYCVAATASYDRSSDIVTVTISIKRGVIEPKSSYAFKVEHIANEGPSIFYGRLHGEINTPFPTILQQVRHYKQRSDTDLVLINGCINDIGAVQRLTNHKVSLDEIRQTTFKGCYDGMKQLLKEASSKFNNAKIIVTGYFQAVSENSKPRLRELAAWFLPYVHASIVASVIASLVFPGGEVLGAIAAPILINREVESFINALPNNWGIFRTVSSEMLQKAVNEVNAEYPCKFCPFSGPRISYANPNFGSHNTIFAEQPFLYGFNKKQNIGNLGNPLLYYLRENKLPITAVDHGIVKAQREHVCTNPGPFALPNSFNRMTCAVASIGHPNPEGAARYADVINSILDGTVFMKPLTNDGALLREVNDPKIYVIYAGAKFYIPNPAEFAALGFSSSNVITVPDGLLAAIPIYPKDGALLKERTNQKIYVLYAGAKFYIPDPATFQTLGFREENVRVVPDGALAALPDIPVVRLVVKEINGPTYVINYNWEAQKRLIPSAEIANRYELDLQFANPFIVPNGALDHIPLGEPLQ